MDIRHAGRLSLIAGILLVSFSVFYYFVVFLPKKELAIIEQRKQENEMLESKESARLQLLENCLDGVDQRMRDTLSLMEGKVVSNASLKIILGIREQQKDECFKKYPLK